MYHQDQDIDQVMYTEVEIAKRVNELAADIRKDYEGKYPYFIGVLTGACMFAADLVRAVGLESSLNFVQASSYREGTAPREVHYTLSSGSELGIKGRNVIIIEDIVDSGHTLDGLIERLQAMEPASIKVCALINKPSRRECQVDIDYKGFDIQNIFVTGYGMDFAGRYRYLKDICTLRESAYHKI